MDKYYLQAENDRNVKSHAIFERVLKTAFGENEVVLVGHHFVIAPDGDITKGVNELPSADTIIFDHVIMNRVFGAAYVNVMMACARKPVEDRDEELEKWLNTYAPIQPKRTPNYQQPETVVEGDYPETAGGY